jgi:hypothetical protein
MPIWDGATTVQLERSSAGQTATVLGAGDAVLATCDDAGRVTGADGSALMTAAFSMPKGAHSGAPGAGLKRLDARVDVADAAGAPAGAVTVRRFAVGPFKKKLELKLLDASGAEVGELVTTDKKAREFAVACGGATVARLTLADRDRSLKQTVERWTLSVESRPAAPVDLLAAAAILRYGKMFAEVSSPGPG